MTFNSYSFIFLYLPAFLLGLFLLQKKISGKENASVIIKLYVIIMSALFFVFFGVFSVGALCVSILYNALWALAISRKKAGVFLAAMGNVLFLCIFKYSDNVMMPIAVSFYTFQQIAYLVELKRGNIEKFDLVDYLSYILFFPKILQGPLADYEKINGELSSLKDKRINSEDLISGFYLFILGLSKKVLLSDVLGVAVNYGYSVLSTLSGLDAIIVAVCYSFQLYFDFSGYCDMAEGICRMCGIELQINFNAPYIAKNIVEFWDRWHITLTGFFTKYLYIPLGGSRKGAFRTYLNILIVFFVSGLWHGSGLTFIVWGMMHGVLMVLTRLCREKKVTLFSKLLSPMRVFLTFSYVTAAWVFFRADTMTDALSLLKTIVTPSKYEGYHIGIKLAECFRLDELWYVLKVTPIPSWKFGGYVCMWLILGLTLVLVFRGKTAKNIADEFRMTLRGANDSAENEVKSKRASLYVKTFIAAILFVWCVLSLGNVATFLYVNF